MLFHCLELASDLESQEIASDLLLSGAQDRRKQFPAQGLLVACDADCAGDTAYWNKLKAAFSTIINLGPPPLQQHDVHLVCSIITIRSEGDSYTLFDQDKGSVTTHSVSYPTRSPVPTVVDHLRGLERASIENLPQSNFAMAGNAINSLRRTSPSALAATMEKSLVELRRIFQLETVFWFGEEHWSSGEVRQLTTISGMKKSLVFELMEEYRHCVQQVSDAFRAALTSRLDFIVFGKSAAESTQLGRYGSTLESLMGWWASYFRGRAVLLAKTADYSGAMQSLNREAELMLHAVALEHRIVELSYSGEVVLEGKRISGLGRLLEAVRPELEKVTDPTVVTALMQSVACRNRSRMGHGVATLSAPIFNTAASTLSTLWRDLANNAHNGPAMVVRSFSGKVPAILFPNPTRVLSEIALTSCRTLPKVSNG